MRRFGAEGRRQGARPVPRHQRARRAGRRRRRLGQPRRRRGAAQLGPAADRRARRARARVNNIYNDPIGHWVVVVLAMVVVLFVLLTGTAYAVWMERVALGHIQRRPGPNRVGPWGLMQSAADGIKLAFKESFIPAETDRIIYVIAPAIAVAAAFLAWSVIPIGLWYNVQYWITR